MLPGKKRFIKLRPFDYKIERGTHRIRINPPVGSKGL